MHQLQRFIALQHPNIDRLTFKDLSEFRTDNGEELIQFQRGAEDLFKVVQLRDPRDRGECVISLLFVSDCVRQSAGGDISQRLQRMERALKSTVESHNFISSSKIT